MDFVANILIHITVAMTEEHAPFGVPSRVALRESRSHDDTRVSVY